MDELAWNQFKHSRRRWLFSSRPFYSKIGTLLMLERFIEEVRRREKVVRIFPSGESAYRLIGALCAERHEEWSTGRRYLTMDAFYEWKASLEPDDDPLPVAA